MNIFFGRILLFGPTVWRQAAVSFRLRNWLLVESSACRTLHIPWARNVRSGELSEGHSSCKQGAFARLAGVYLNSLQQTVGRHSWAQWMIKKTRQKLDFEIDRWYTYSCKSLTNFDKKMERMQRPETEIMWLDWNLFGKICEMACVSELIFDGFKPFGITV